MVFNGSICVPFSNVQYSVITVMVRVVPGIYGRRDYILQHHVHRDSPTWGRFVPCTAWLSKDLLTSHAEENSFYNDQILDCDSLLHGNRTDSVSLNIN